MKLLRLGLALLVTTFAASALHAQAIWKWRNRDGRIEVSDRAPPPDIPESSILQRPGGGRMPAATAAVAAPGAAEASAPASSPARSDSELDARNRKLQAEQAERDEAKKASDTARKSAQKADNCRRARTQLAGLESGGRVARLNDKGEREFLDDAGRADEIQRARKQVDSNCR